MGLRGNVITIKTGCTDSQQAESEKRDWQNVQNVWLFFQFDSNSTPVDKRMEVVYNLLSVKYNKLIHYKMTLDVS